MRIDLHTHSIRSDGTDTPAELMTKAAAAGLDVIALTDHDTTAGWQEATEALPAGLRLVPGVELSCIAHNAQSERVSIHLLAYLFDPASQPLVKEQQRLRMARKQRLRKMADMMADDGLPIDPDEVMAGFAENTSAGRPHLGAALIRAGLVDSMDEAFSRFFGSKGKYYVPSPNIAIESAIDLIKQAGGVTVLAHPFAQARGKILDADMIAKLAEHGLAGVEVDHYQHDQQARAQLRGLAKELSLIVTGSSDYHGRNKTVQLGQETTDPGMLAALIDASSGARVIST